MIICQDQAKTLAVIKYFDIFYWPVSLLEVFRYQIVLDSRLCGNDKLSLNKISKVLDELISEGRIAKKNGFYFFPGRENLVEQRALRYKIAERKFRKAIKLIRILRFFPFVRSINICNTLSYSNASENSDIDFFVITKKNRVWTARFFVNLFLKIFNLRPRPNKSRDKFCFSFWVDEENLDFEELKCEKSDWYLIFWISQIVNIYDEHNLCSRFFKINLWIKKFLPNIVFYEISPKRKIESKFLNLKKVFEFIVSIIGESVLRNLQIKIMPDNLKKLANKNTNVILGNGIIKLHDKDKRREYNEKFLSK